MAAGTGSEQEPGQICEFDGLASATLDLVFFGSYTFGSTFRSTAANGVVLGSVDETGLAEISDLVVVAGARFDNSGTAISVTGGASVVFDGAVTAGATGISVIGPLASVLQIGGSVNAGGTGVQLEGGAGSILTTTGTITAQQAVRVVASEAEIDIGGRLDDGQGGAAGTSGVNADLDDSVLGVTGTLLFGDSGVSASGSGNEINLSGEITADRAAVLAVSGSQINISGALLGSTSGLVVSGNSNTLNVTGLVAGDLPDTGSTGGVALDIVGDDNTVTVADGATLRTGSSGLAVTGDGNTVTVDAEIQSSNAGIVVQGNDFGSVNTVRLNSDLRANNVGVLLSDGSSVFEQGAGSTIFVDVDAVSDARGLVLGSGTRATIGGSIDAGGEGGVGALVAGGALTVTGSISALRRGVIMEQGFAPDGTLIAPTLRVEDGATVVGSGVGIQTRSGAAEITIAGTVTSLLNGIRVSNDTQLERNITVTVESTGRIVAPIAIRDDAPGGGDPEAGGLSLTNAGDIEGLVELNAGADTVVNSGLIRSLDAGAGDDVVVNTGRITVLTELGSGDDRYSGGDDSERVDDGSGADVVLLGAGADVVLTGADRGDRFDGGAGEDSIIMDLRSTAVTVDFFAGTIARGGEVDATFSGFESIVTGDGNDRIIGDNAANFLSGAGGDDVITGDAFTPLPPNSVEAQVFRAYQAVLGRAPDAAGFQAFTNAVKLGQLSQQQVIADFVTSPEFQATYGTLSNRTFVELLYNNVLGRDGDADGIAAFTAVLDGGAERSAVVIDFANSAEFIGLTALSSAAFATNVVINPVEGDVFRAYQAVFDRAPDAAGFELFVGAVLAGVLSLEQVVAEFVASDEFQDTYGALDNAAFVELLYDNVLPGNEDPAGRAAFTAALDGGRSRASVVNDFVTSFEFARATQDAAVAFTRDAYDGLSDDTLSGGTGNDTLFGGRGDDVFIIGDGVDRILDFTLGQDTIDASALNDDLADSFADVIGLATQRGQDTVFDFGEGNVTTLANVQLSDLTADDFIFEAPDARKPPADPAAEAVPVEDLAWADAPPEDLFA